MAHDVRFTFQALSAQLMALIQMDSGYKETKFSSRLLFVFSSAFAYLMFAYYNAVLTSLMTSAAPKVTINSFRDVVEKELKVFVWRSSSAEQVLQNAPIGTNMNKAYEDMINRDDVDKYVTNTPDSLQKIR